MPLSAKGEEMKTGEAMITDNKGLSNQKEEQNLRREKKVNLKRTIILTVVTMLAAGINASAGVLTLELGYVFEGSVDPSGPAPWVTAVFDDGGTAGSVDLTITAALGTDLGEKVGSAFFNLDPALAPSDLVFSDPVKAGVFADPTVLHDPSPTEYPADGGGYYDIKIDFDTNAGDEFNNSDSVSYTITGISGLTAESFNFIGDPHGGSGPFVTAAHMQGLGVDNQDSSWITVPEPATMILLGLGSVLLRKRK
jgi:hypothetical protein